MAETDRFGRRSVLSCPDCGGVMWEIDEGDLMRFRCHVGHTYSAELLNVALDENLRRALASARRALEERLALATKLEKQAAESGHRLLTENWGERVREYQGELGVIRESIRRMDEIAANSAANAAAAAE
jgi:two-component system chemotaxis response regulator CheB